MRGLIVAGGWIALLLAACSGQPESLETEIRAFVAKAESAAEQRNAGELRALIAEDYLDAQGHDRRTIEQLIDPAARFSQSVHSCADPDSRHRIS